LKVIPSRRKSTLSNVRGAALWIMIWPSNRSSGCQTTVSFGSSRLCRLCESLTAIRIVGCPGCEFISERQVEYPPEDCDSSSERNRVEVERRRRNTSWGRGQVGVRQSQVHAQTSGTFVLQTAIGGAIAALARGRMELAG
jgi:hypothetical protein